MLNTAKEAKSSDALAWWYFYSLSMKIGFRVV